MAAETNNAINSKQPNASFYFKDDPMAIFLVQNQLFKVHRHYLIEGSEFFRGLFDCPAEEGGSVEGMSNEQPIPLPEVTVEEFESLLEFFYSIPTGEPGTVDVLKAQKRNLNLLSISHRYVFDKVFNYAVKQLQTRSIPVVERLKLGDKYGLQDWLSSAYQELLDRNQVMNEVEIMALGAGRIIQFLKAKNFMQEERLNIANENAHHQQTRAEYLEKYRFAANSSYNVPSPRRPTGTEIVVKRHFF